MVKLSHSSEMDRRGSKGGHRGRWGGSQSSVRGLPGEVGEVGRGGEEEGRGGFFHTLTFVPPHHPTPPFIGSVCVCVFEGAAEEKGGDWEGRVGHKWRMWQRFELFFCVCCCCCF